MFCNNCGSQVDENADFCGNCGAKLRQEGNVSEVEQKVSEDAVSLKKEQQNFGFEGQEPGRVNRDVVYDDADIKGKFKWGGGAIAWFVIMIVWQGFAIFSEILSFIGFGGIKSAANFSSIRGSLGAENAELISSIFDLLNVFLVVAFVVSVIIIIAYSVLLGKKKKNMFYLLIFGYAASLVSSIVQAFVFSGKIDAVSKLFRELSYSDRKGLQFILDMTNGMVSVSVIISALISVGLVVATYFIIKKNWNRLA